RLAEAIAAAPGLQVSGVAARLPSLRELFAEAGVPDLLLVDLMLPPAHVKALLNDLRHNTRQKRPLLLVLAVSADDPRVMQALCDGADGYFAQAQAPQSLPAALQQLLSGESTMTPQIARQLKSHFEAMARDGAAATRAPGLCDADWRLLQWMAEGFLVTEVARGLQLSIHELGVRIRDLYRALQCDMRAGSSTLSAA
ncbi:MAG TPA: hypothetical protein VGP22_05275, partial [Albitalea sp.]|nr:hypothetical protein [Albitalea sp.]